MASNTRFSVALHALAFLAWKGGPMSSSRIARSVGTNPVVIRRLLRRLADAGLVSSQRGALGGTELARSSDRISLLEVYEAASESRLLASHKPNRYCPFSRAIRPGLDELVGDVESGVRDALAGRTLADAMETLKRNATSDLL